ncbi:MAG: alpha/beta hydrolase [Elusimicrobia bacterium]|nr:alpha/beta hydrolase [Elusimicrobiota bacterium]
MTRLVLFTGMGADRRLTDPVRPAGADFVNPDHLEPEPGELLPAYAARCADAAGLRPGDFVGGVSFGGMVAAEAARQRPVKGLVLLGSTIHPERLPVTYRWFEHIGPVLPDVLLRVRRWGPFIRTRFGPLSDEGVALLQDMVDVCPPSRIRAFGRMIVRWRGPSAFACPVLSVHGDRDRVIPPFAAEKGLMLKGAGHCFTLTHAAETVAALSAFLQPTSAR